MFGKVNCTDDLTNIKYGVKRMKRIKMKRDRRPWFGPDPTGFGWGPRTWQGLVVVGTIVVGATAAILLILGR